MFENVIKPSWIYVLQEVPNILYVSRHKSLKIYMNDKYKNF